MEYKVSRYERRHPGTFRSAYLKANRGYRLLDAFFDSNDCQQPEYNPKFYARISPERIDLGSAHSCILGMAFEPAHYYMSHYENGEYYTGWDLGRDLLHDSGWIPDPVPDYDDRWHQTIDAYECDYWYSHGFVFRRGPSEETQMLEQAWYRIICWHMHWDDVVSPDNRTPKAV